MRSLALGCVAAAALILALPAQAATMSECAAQWKAAKAAKQTEGKTYREFSKACMGGAAVAQADPATPDKPDTSKDSDLRRQAGVNDIGAASGKKANKNGDAGAATDKPAAKANRKKSASPAAQRQRACGAEWKADKAAGKVEKGMTWPKYWSACSKRKKAESA
jgi:hypothetical protein